MITLVQGEDVEIIIKFELENEDAFDLTTVTAIEACFVKADNTSLVKTLGAGVEVVGALPQNGKIKISLSDADTNSLKVGSKQHIEVKLSEGTKDKIIQFPNELEVKKRLC